VKNIVLLSDGTGNSAAKRHKTNVWRLYEALNLHDKNQIAMYDDGVGSQENFWSKVLGGAFGYGLKRNVIELYKYLCRNYRDAEQNDDGVADKIFLFGFSRGAFTVRVLVGFIKYAGLNTDYDSEETLHDWTVDIYRNYRSKYKHGYLSRIWFRLFANQSVSPGNIKPDIEFVGVWDTVDAYVFPMDELAIIWDRLIYPIRFPDKKLSSRVHRACHAVSVDDERQTFHPVMWDEADESGRIEQVWFPGVHSDVGGGYPRRSLSLVTLDWMMTKVESDQVSNGLVFIDEIREQYHSQSDWNGPQHNSRSGLAMYYRYKPRNIALICNDPDTGVAIKHPKIHRSVFERIKGRSTPYAPTGIPAGYEVVDNEGDPPEFETPEQRDKRSAALNYALDTIYWRRWVYFALLLLTLSLIASRFFLEWDEHGVCKGSACFVDPVLRFFVDSLPDFLGAWFDALRQNPMWLWSFAILYGVFFVIRKKTRNATQRYATCAWSILKGKEEPPVWKDSLTSKLRQLAETSLKPVTAWTGAVLIFLVIVYLLFAVINGSLFHLRNTLGLLCENSSSVSVLTTPRTTSLDIGKACFATGIKLEQGKTYLFEVADAVLHDGKNHMTDPDGDSWVGLFPYVPLRRHITEPWITLYGKVDDGGDETFVLGKGVTEYTARADGELFLYVNDAVFGVLPEWDLAYRWPVGKNSGIVPVRVRQLEPIKRAQ
jgi:uncharacterized protein (DUF2235 family)